MTHIPGPDGAGEVVEEFVDDVVATVDCPGVDGAVTVDGATAVEAVVDEGTPATPRGTELLHPTSDSVAARRPMNASSRRHAMPRFRSSCTHTVAQVQSTPGYVSKST